MDTTELIARVRRTAFIRDNHPDFTDAVILDELNDGLRSVYLDIMTGPRQGYWLKQNTVTIAPTQANSFRAPPRAVVGGFEKVEIGPVGGTLSAIPEVTENHAQWYESFSGRTGMPQYFVMRGDAIDFLPFPDQTYSYRTSYYLKPSLLVQPQPTPAGTIASINTALETVTLVASGTAPVHRTSYMGATIGAVLAVGDLVDIVRPNGLCEVIFPGASISSIALGPPIVYTLSTSSNPGSFAEVRAKDVIRAENEADWPQLPEEFHRTVADVAAVKIMLEMHMVQKASSIAQSVGGDLERLRGLVSTSRVRNSPKTIGLSMITMGGGRRTYPRFP